MSRLVGWLDHRMEVMGIEKWKDLSERTGIAGAMLREVRKMGSLEILGRSLRRALAIALRVSLRRLEQLDHGERDWIEDAHVYDADGYRRPLPDQEEDPAYWTPKETGPERRGTPLIGRIRSTGQVELDEDWHPEWGKHVPLRFGAGNRVFALELEPMDSAVVLRIVAPCEMREGKAAVYCWNGWETNAWFGDVCLQPKSYVITPDRQRHELDLSSIVRIGRIVGRWPRSSGAA